MYWLIGLLVDWLIDGLIDWLTDWLTDWMQGDDPVRDVEGVQRRVRGAKYGSPQVHQEDQEPTGGSL